MFYKIKLQTLININIIIWKKLRLSQIHSNLISYPVTYKANILTIWVLQKTNNPQDFFEAIKDYCAS